MATSSSNLSNFKLETESLNTGCLAIDLSGQVVHANRPMAALIEYQPEELVGTNLFQSEWIAVQDAAPILNILNERGSTDNFQEFERVLTCKSGRQFNAAITVESWKQAEEPFALILINEVTTSRRTPRRVLRAERHLQDLLNNTSELVFIVNRSGIVTSANAAFHRSLGYSKQDLRTIAILDIVRGNHRDRLNTALKHMSPEQKVQLEPVQFGRKNGEFTWLGGSLIYQFGEEDSDSVMGIFQELSNVQPTDSGQLPVANLEANDHRSHSPRGSNDPPISATQKDHLGESVLRESDNHLRITQQTAKMGSFEVFPGSVQIDYCSEEFLRLLDLTSSIQIPTCNDFIENFVLGEDRSRVQTAMEDCRQRATPFDLEYRLKTAEGVVRCVHQKGEPTGRGSVDGFGIRATIQDITDQNASELERRAAERKFQAIFENEPECVKLLDRNGILLNMNAAGLALVDAKSIDEVKGQCVYSIVAPEYRAFYKLENEAVFEGATRRLQFDIIALSGTRRRMESHQTPLRDEAGKIIANLAVTRDITQQRLTENRLRESEAFWRSLTESSNDHIVTLDCSLRIVYSNKGVMGMEPSELVGQSVHVLTEFSQQAHVENILNQVLENGQPSSFESFSSSLGSDNKYFESRVSARIVEGQIIGLTINIRDISKIKRAEMALRYVVSGTARDTGTAFYNSITEKLAEAINVEHVFVAESIGRDLEQLRTLSFWSNNGHRAEVIFERDGSPCEFSATQSECFLGDGVREAFPECNLIRELAARSYVGLKLHASDGSPLGIIAALSNQPLECQEEVISLMRIFADRIASEIERNRTHQDLQDSNQKLDKAHERLNLAVNGTSDGLWDWNIADQRVWISANGMSILGYQRREKVAKTRDWTSLIHSEDIQHFKNSLDQHFQHARRFDVEIRVTSTSQKIVWLHLRGEATRDSNGKPIRMSGSMQDVTQQRQGERALKESENRMRILLGQVPAILWATDRDLNFTMIAGAALRKTHMSPENSWKNVQRFFEIQHPSDIPMQKHQAALAGRAGSFKSELRERSYQNYVEPLRNDSNKIVGTIGVALDVTEHKLAEDSLEQSERKYRTLFENLPIGVVISDESGNLLDFNDSYVDLAGAQNKSQLIGNNLLDFCANLSDLAPILDRVANGGTARRQELQLQRTGGESYDALVSIAPLNFNHRRCLLSVFEDISDRKKLENKLQRFKYMLDSSGEAIFLLDPVSAKFIDVNPACHEQLGYSRDELIGMNFFQVQILGDHTTSEQWENLVSLLRVKTSHSISGSHQRKDGTTFPVELTVSLSRHEGREFMLAIARDVTERKIVEKSLGESEARARSLLENHVDGVAVVSAGKILYANEPLCTLLGSPRSRIEGQSIQRLVQVNGETKLDNGKREFLNNQIMESELWHQDGFRLPVEIAKRQFRFQGQESVLYVFRDIAKRKELEQEARKHRELVAHVSRIATLGEMATGLAHELNQPLSAICMFSEACNAEFRSEKPDYSKIPLILNHLSEQSMRAGAIVDRIRKFVGKEEFRQTDYRLQLIIDDVLQLLKLNLTEKEIEVSLQIDAESDIVFVDPVQIEQVVVNLVQNSIDAIGNLKDSSGGLIEIKARQYSKEFLEVSIRDTGHGMSKSEVEEVFNAFYTTKNHGMGMGLAICRTIIEGHHGQINMNSSPQEGTVCRFTLPVHSKAIHSKAIEFESR